MQIRASGAMFNSQWDGKVKAVIDKIKYNNIYGIGNDFYLTFEDEEDIFFFGRNIVLGNKTFDYIRIHCCPVNRNTY